VVRDRRAGALQQRHVTGKGCVIDTSLLDSAASWVDSSLATYHITQELSPRTGAATPTIVPYQAFETADHPLVIAAGYDRLFHKLATVLGFPNGAPTLGLRRAGIVSSIATH
jgi:formyl-CoA transferase